jgi:hypothetical protein
VCRNIGFWIKKAARGRLKGALNWHSALFLKQGGWDDVETIAIKFRLKARAIDGVVGGRCDAFEKGVS